MVVSEQTIWLVPILFYLADNFVLCDEGQFLLYEDGLLKWRAGVELAPFFWRSKIVCMLNPFLPYTGVRRLPWRGRLTNHNCNRKVCNAVLVANSSMPMRFVGTVSFILLFFTGPWLTHEFGLTSALLVVMPVHLCLAAVATAVIVQRSSVVAGYYAIFDFIVCPGYLPNVCRRYTLQFGVGFGSWIEPTKRLLDSQDALDFGEKIEQARANLYNEEPESRI